MRQAQYLRCGTDRAGDPQLRPVSPMLEGRKEGISAHAVVLLEKN